MSFFWDAIRNRENEYNIDSKRSELAAYGWALLSDNYKQVAIKQFNASDESMKTYVECRLLTDMISGMTDGFAMSLRNQLKDGGHLGGGNA